ncbi:GNAT family N-acetyltransferase [Microbacterium sp. RG1]|uniref:GNAT family N-acetyltransferase n=1 Tax=Microbacterium sp. RG1 TaxID=2489212 RepID=UPI0010CA455B|nr:GNAT family protein [Microbacterium sp. RG1]QCQ15365.1 N-acetyltransferase [Microbacterium sp. RG1]
MSGWSEAPLLENAHVRLEQLAPEHADDLAAAVAVDELWRTWYTRIPSPDGMRDEIESRLERQRAGLVAPWAIVSVRDGRAVGMTTYLNLDETNRRLEIGSTWMGRAAQGIGINPAAKLLLLERAFDQLGCGAVEFRTHWHNHQSRAAIARLGAKQDGVLRNHTVWSDGTMRDTVVFSVIDGEWPTVRAALTARLRHR